jgi:hypothetical protein
LSIFFEDHKHKQFPKVSYAANTYLIRLGINFIPNVEVRHIQNESCLSEAFQVNLGWISPLIHDFPYLLEIPLPW